MALSDQPAENRPSHRINRMSVIGGFLDGLDIEFADGLNCFIGGRGTGKTTVLELMRFAFDALPSRETEGDEWRRFDALIEQNLGGGRVQIEFQTIAGLRYVASRAWDEEPVILSKDGQPTQLTLKSGGIFRADIFSQNEIERIADRTVSQLVLIDRFEAEAIADIESKIRQVQQELSASAYQLSAIEQRQSALRDEIATLPEVEEQLKGFVGSGGEDAEAVDKAHSAKASRDREQGAIESLYADIEYHERELQTHSGWLKQQLITRLDEDICEGPNKAAWTELANQLALRGQEIDLLLKQASEKLELARQAVIHTRDILAIAHDSQEMVFRALIEKHEQLMEQATERARLERLRNSLMAQRRELVEVTAKADTLKRQRAGLLENLSELCDGRYSVRQNVATRINSQVEPMIRVTLDQFGELDEYRQVVVDSLRAAGVHHNVVAQKITDALPPRELVECIRRKDSRTIAQQGSINATQATKVVECLSGTAVLYALEAVALDDRPRIELKDGETYKDSMSVSKGQKCTSILPILLLDSDRPLLVDQPEDNLDNGFIYETVVARIREVKKFRQLLFVTHNPNIPVLGEASKVFVFRSNGTQGWIEASGSVEHCKQHIVTLLEGGEEAFRRRQEKYSY